MRNCSRIQSFRPIMKVYSLCPKLGAATWIPEIAERTATTKLHTSHIKEASKCSIPLTLSNARTICLKETSLTTTFLKQVSYSAPCLINFLSTGKYENRFCLHSGYSSHSSNNCTRQIYMETPINCDIQ